MQKIIKGISIIYPDCMELKEVEMYLEDEIKHCNYPLSKVIISLDKDQVEIKSFEKSPISRVRRITGYLSVAKNFNNAKLAELNARVAHL